MRRIHPLLLLVALLFMAWLWHQHQSSVPGQLATSIAASQPAASTQANNGELPSYLPEQARDTLRAIAQGGPFEHTQDGSVFGNYEGLLPKQPRGYYHEYTVETPDAHNRGARRIITGGTPPTVWYYTGDHYRSFQRFEVPR